MIFHVFSLFTGTEIHNVFSTWHSYFIWHMMKIGKKPGVVMLVCAPAFVCTDFQWALEWCHRFQGGLPPTHILWLLVQGTQTHILVVCLSLTYALFLGSCKLHTDRGLAKKVFGNLQNNMNDWWLNKRWTIQQGSKMKQNLIPQTETDKIQVLSNLGRSVNNIEQNEER